MTTLIVTNPFDANLLNLPKELLAMVPEVGQTTMDNGGFILAEDFDVKYITALILIEVAVTSQTYDFYLNVYRGAGLLATSDTVRFTKPANETEGIIRINFPFDQLFCETGVDYKVNVVCNKSTYQVIADFPETYFSSMVQYQNKVNPKYEILGYRS